MESIYLLIPIALIFVALAIAAYLWAVNSEQYKDLDKEAHRILFDNDSDNTPEASPPSAKDNDERSGS